MRRILRELLIATGAFLCLYLFLVLVGNWYVVNGTSMHPGLRQNDFVYVNKWCIGPRLPYTPLGIPLGQKVYWPVVEWRYHRWWSDLDDLKNRVIAFNRPDTIGDHPIDRRKVLLKRVIGMPGDTLRLEGGHLFINGKRDTCNNPALRAYRVTLQDSVSGRQFWTVRGIRVLQPLQRKNSWLVLLTADQYRALRKHHATLMAMAVLEDKRTRGEGIYPGRSSYFWNRDFFGPICIPYRGMTIPRFEFELYAPLLHHNPGESFSDTLFSYTFREDYFFVLGDNRYQSEDSRHFGPVPESALIGVVDHVLFSSASEDDAYFRGRWFLNVK